MSEQKLMLIDGNSILNRAYYALPVLNDVEGRNTNAVYGFVNILLKALQEYAPDRLVIAFDKPGHNFRKDLYPEYKANRTGMPSDLVAQLPILFELLDAMHVCVVQKEGVEADDIIGTVATAFDGRSFIISGDRDMWQLVSDSVTVLFTKRGVSEVEVIDRETLRTVYNLTPEQVVEYKALRGDTSDNIPGVRGIGEKTAMSLLQKYGNIDNLYANLDSEKGKLRESLATCKDMAYTSRKLATIDVHADVSCDVARAALPVFDGKVKYLLKRLQFKSIVNRLSFVDIDVHQEVDVTVNNVTTEAQLHAAVEQMARASYFAFMWDGSEVYLSDSKTAQYRIVLSDSFLDELSSSVVWSALKPLLESDVCKAVYDSKSLRHALDGVGIRLVNVRYDISLMQYLVQYSSLKDIENLCLAYGYKQFCVGLFALAEILDGKLREMELDKLYYDIELPLSELLYRMEVEGVRVDVELLNKMSAEMHLQIDTLTDEIYALAGGAFNINSPMQLSRVLFEQLGLPHGKKMQKGYSTGNDILEKLLDKHPIVEKILAYRATSKLLGTYVDGLKPLVRGGIVHTTFNQTLTSTGRLSSSDPNLQNIPIRNDRGKEIRKLFCSKNGVFVGADYSQIELRLVAAFSGDSNMLESFRNNEDIHLRVASEILGIPAEMVNHDMRRMAKAVNFGIIYGISDFGLSNNVNLSVQKAHDYIDLYFKRFPSIKDYLDGNVRQAKEQGYVTTITGRRRPMPEVNSSNYNVRMFGERAAMNMPVQGSAADIMKIAMLNVDAAIRAAGLRSSIVLQVHDELIVDCYLDEADRVKQILKEQMEHAVTLACPLTVETEEGATLYEA